MSPSPGLCLRLLSHLTFGLILTMTLTIDLDPDPSRHRLEEETWPLPHP